MGKRDRRGGRAGSPNPSGRGVSFVAKRLWSSRMFLFIVRATNVRSVAEVLACEREYEPRLIFGRID